MPEFTDQTGRRVYLAGIPRRIVSLVPSITEYLADLGLQDRLVGITKFCVHPESVFQNVTRIGGTKDFKVDKIASLKPDLIVANKEENEADGIARLALQFPVWVSEISTVSDALAMMDSLGQITGKPDISETLIQKISTGFDEIKKIQNPEKPRVLYLIWRNPYMAAGTDTYISDVLKHLGWENALSGLGTQGTRYPIITPGILHSLKPDLILLSSEPYPFTEKHTKEFASIALKSVHLVDGEAFSWYGSRMAKSVPYLIRLQKEIAG